MVMKTDSVFCHRFQVPKRISSQGVRRTSIMQPLVSQDELDSKGLAQNPKSPEIAQRLEARPSKEMILDILPKCQQF